MGRPVTVTAVRVTLGAARARTSRSASATSRALAALAPLAPVAPSAGPGGVVRLTLASPAQGRYVLVWLTKLPPDPAGTYKAEIYGIAVKGHP